MIPTISVRSSAPHFLGQTVMSFGGKKLVMLAAALLALFVLVPKSHAGSVRVDIYSTYDPGNAPSGGPYSGLAGHLDLSSDVFTGLGYSFGNPFGLSSFAAVITFTQYMSTTGFYSGGLDSGNAPVLWTKGGAPDPFYGGAWAAGAAFGEVMFNAGFNDFELVFLAGNDFGEGFGGTPRNLSLAYFEPWGGDPQMADGAYSYVTTSLAAKASVLSVTHVADSGHTLALLVGTFAAGFALRRRFGGRTRG